MKKNGTGGLMKRIKQRLNTMWQHIYKMAKESPYDKFREGEIHGYLRALYENKLITAVLL